MKLRLPFELKIPVLYVNPPFHTDPGLLRKYLAREVWELLTA